MHKENKIWKNTICISRTKNKKKKSNKCNNEHNQVISKICISQHIKYHRYREKKFPE